jgi:alpha-galactosidase
MRTSKWPLLAAVWTVVLTMNAVVRGDDLVTPGEMTARDRWVEGTLLSQDKPIASFLYGGIPSGELLPGWRKAPLSSQSLSDGRTQHQIEWTDSATGLEVRVAAIEYGDYPVVEWTAYLKNTGAKVTPLIENVLGLDSKFHTSMDAKDCILRTTQGDNFSGSSYEPLSYKLDLPVRSFQPAGGRPTNGAWPYFNLDGGQAGVILALGWPGQWQARFSREGSVISARGGQETTHLVLEPGEEIRTPLMAVLFWKGENWIAGQNLWRHWFLRHDIPRPEGKPPAPMVPLVRPVLVLNGSLEMAAARNEKEFVDYYLRLGGVKLDALWIDAGWYETKEAAGSQGVDWAHARGIGTWKPDPVRFPRGIREVSDYVHGKGMKLILWFEPERVYRGSFLWENHPEWLLKWGADDKGNENQRLLNLGDPAARKWLTDYVGEFISEQGVDLYRQDFNVDPLKAWQINDGPDRQGMTENLYVQGFLAYWDGLLSRHPGMLIDSCASGGRRIDLETLRRAIPLLRSDYQAPNLPFSPEDMTTDVFDGNQGHTYGLSLWVPYYGTGVLCEDVYSARSHLCPAMSVGTDLDTPDWAAFRRQVADSRLVGDYFYGDYYPLTPYSKAEDVWMAWEFVRPEKGDGMLQAFRRENSPEAAIRLRLHGLKEGAQYEFTDLDTGRKTKAPGGELMAEGLLLKASAPRTALIVTFKEMKER